MPRLRIPITLAALTSKDGRGSNASEDLVNFYPVREDGASKAAITLVGTPGHSLFAFAPGEQVLGLVSPDGASLYGITDKNVFSVNRDGVATTIATLERPAVGYFEVAVVYNAILFVSPITGDAYRIGLPDGGVDELFLDFVPSSVASAFGRFVLSEAGTDRFHWTEVLSDSIDGLSFATAERRPDGIVGIRAYRERLWLIGKTGTEVWAGTGDFEAPFAPVPGGVIDEGSLYQRTMSAANDALFWVGDNGNVFMARDYSPTAIANNAVRAQLGKPLALVDANATTYAEDGLDFYQLNLPSLKVSWVYDITLGAWHKRKTSSGAIPSQFSATAWGQVFTAGEDSPIVRKQSLSIYTYDGKPIIREIISAPIERRRKLMPFQSFEVEVDVPPPGVSMSMRRSNDAGRSWSFQSIRSVLPGDPPDNRFRWVGEGLARDRRYHLRIVSMGPLSLPSRAFLEAR